MEAAGLIFCMVSGVCVPRAAGAALRITAPLEIPTLIKEGLGTLCLKGDNRFAGAVTVQEGSLVINSAATLALKRCRIRALPGVVVADGTVLDADSPPRGGKQ
jgi:autotransporter-associated beta strand protein